MYLSGMHAVKAGTAGEGTGFKAHRGSSDSLEAGSSVGGPTKRSVCPTQPDRVSAVEWDKRPMWAAPIRPRRETACLVRITSTGLPVRMYVKCMRVYEAKCICVS